MKMFYCMIVFLVQIFPSLQAMEGRSSYPYLSGYTWGFFCDWRLIDQDYGSSAESFDPEWVGLGDTILVDLRRMEEFARDYLPKIKHPIILVTSNYGFDADHAIPGPFEYLLHEEKIAAWVGQNINYSGSDKLIPIAIGIANAHWEHGNTKLFDQFITLALSKTERSRFCYLNVTPRPERQECIAHFQQMGVPFENNNKPFEQYLADLSDSRFVISPPGNGIDCHRTWEALLMGCYPVVQSSAFDSLYDDLPVVIVDDWSIVTEEFLKEKEQELKAKTWSRDKLYAPYWFAKIQEIQEQLRG